MRVSLWASSLCFLWAFCSIYGRPGGDASKLLLSASQEYGQKSLKVSSSDTSTAVILRRLARGLSIDLRWRRVRGRVFWQAVPGTAKRRSLYLQANSRCVRDNSVRRSKSLQHLA